LIFLFASKIASQSKGMSEGVEDEAKPGNSWEQRNKQAARDIQNPFFLL